MEENRLNRIKQYLEYLSIVYGEEIKKTQTLAIIPSVKHELKGMIASELFIKQLFPPAINS